MSTSFERAMGVTAILMLIGSGCGDGSSLNPVGETPVAGGAGTAAISGSPAPAGAGTVAGQAAAGTASAAGRSGASGTGTMAPPTGTAGRAAGDPPAGGTGAAPTAGTGAPMGGMGAAGAPAAGGAGPAAGMGAPPAAAGALPKVMTTDGPGPWGEVVKVMNTPPGGWMIYPKDIGKDGVKHPLFVFGPGGGTTPATYESMGKHWDRYGSYGFVIYVLPRSTGDGAAMKAGLDWLIEQNDAMASPLFQKLDTTKICASGHSQGSVTTFDFMPDDRVTTTIHISGGSFDGKGPSNLKNPTMFLCGPTSGADVAFPQCEGDFTNSKVPTFYTNIQGSDHLTSGRMGWPAIIAWMLWHLAGHEEWKKEFLEPTGQFQMGMYKSQIKNW